MREIMNEDIARYRLFDEGFDCAQVTLSHFSAELELDDTDAKKIASAFGGGMFCGEVCGCVSGSLMALGLKYGFCTPNDTIGKKSINDKADAFKLAFIDKHGSLRCKDLLGYDVSIPEEKQLLFEKGVIQQKCPGFVVSACSLLDSLLGN